MRWLVKTCQITGDLACWLDPLYEGKGNTRVCVVYRGVKLLEHWLNILEHAFERSIRDIVEVNEIVTFVILIFFCGYVV